MSHHTSSYRPEIDGLRAVAVVSVILFHAGVPPFTGGYVGVDVFFVISGYLITSLLLNEVDAGTFSIARFYERRIRRLFPALFCMIVTCLIVGSMILVPTRLAEFGQSQTAAVLFLSNLLFWTRTGYFDRSGDHDILLHTWSLAVEEQYYIVFPVFLLAIARLLSRRYTAWTIGVLALSLALSIWSVRHAPTAGFYWAPMRAWELLLGALLAMGAVPSLPGWRFRTLFSLLGLGLIAWSALRFSSATPFPGARALVPCMGAWLIIYAESTGRSLVGRFLAMPPVVFVGLISYSLYLWHWPILAFAKYVAFGPLSIAGTTACLAATTVIAALSWRYVEQPLRRRGGPSKERHVFVRSGSAVVVLAAAGLVIHAQDGFPGRFGPDIAHLFADVEVGGASSEGCQQKPFAAPRVGMQCRLGDEYARPPSFVVWGDSHAKALRPGLDAVAKDVGRVGLLFQHSACPPLLGIERVDQPAVHACVHFNDRVFEEIVARDSVKTVVLVARWALNATGERYGLERGNGAALADAYAAEDRGADTSASFRRGLYRTVEAIRRHGKRVVVVAQAPAVGRHVPETLALFQMLGKDWTAIGPTVAEHQARQSAVTEAFQRLAGKDGVQILYPHRALCNHEFCRVAVNGRPLYADEDHLSPHGALQVQPILREIFSQDPGVVSR